jgi:endonuclease/exonuclease/phosphatase (EEP) superfamily protein YafD
MKSELSPKQSIAAPRLKRRRSALVAFLDCLYLISLVGLIAFLRTCGDRTWLGTVLLFSPRWPALLPLVILLPITLWKNRPMLIVLLVSILVAIFPLMQFGIGGLRKAPAVGSGLPIRVVAFNVHHQPLTAPQAVAFFASVHPDIVAIEEIVPGFNTRLFPRESWHTSWRGELFIASRFPIIQSKNLSDEAITQYVLSTPAGPIDFAVVHLASPHYSLQDAIEGSDPGNVELARNIRFRADESAILARLAARSHHPLILAGDFNLLPDSPLFVSRFSTLSDSFEKTGTGFGWTYLGHWTAVRIDHVLSSNGVVPTAFSIGPWLGSPHRPIIADLVLVQNANR